MRHKEIDLTGVAVPVRVPSDLTEPKALKTASDWELYQVIAEGGQVLGLAPKMLPWKDMLDERELRDVVAYVRSLAPRK